MKIKRIFLMAITIVALLAISVSSLTACNDDGDLGPACTVSFDSNGGSAVAAISSNVGLKVAPPASPTKNGYVFAGWYLGENLWVFAENSLTESITLKAKWIAKESDNTVTFFTDGGSVIPSAVIPTSGKITKPSNPTKLGYEFDAWIDAQGADWNFDTVVSESTVLTAKWSVINYDITYNLGDDAATNAESNPATYNIETELTALAAPSRDGYVFTGWTYAGVDTPELSVSIGGGDIGALEFTANWEEAPEFATYDIIYNLAGGVNANDNPATYSENGSAITLLAPTRAHYDFIGWTFDGVTEPVKTVTIDPSSDSGAKEYTANWKATVYNIQYVLYGGEHIGNPASYTVEDLPLSIKPAEKEGLHFAGWYANADLIIPAPTTINVNNCGNLTLYAKFIDGTDGLVYTINDAGNAYTVTGYVGSDSKVYIAYTHENLPVVAIANDVFKGLGITEIVIPEGVTSIGESAFSGCSTLAKVSIPSTVNFVGNNAFNGCAINSYNEYNGVQYLGNATNPYNVVMKAVSMSDNKIEIHENASVIYSEAFKDVSGVKEIVLPEGIVTICDNAFSGLTSLTSLNIPDGIKTVGMFAFHNCTGLSYTDENGAKYLGNDNNKYLILISLDTSVTQFTVKSETAVIYAYALYGNNNLVLTFAGNRELVYINPTGNDVAFK